MGFDESTFDIFEADKVFTVVLWWWERYVDFEAEVDALDGALGVPEIGSHKVECTDKNGRK